LKHKLIILGFFLLVVMAPSFLKAAVTLPENYDEQPPVAVRIPQDIPLSIPHEALKSEGIRILFFADGGTGNPLETKVAKAMENLCKKNGCHLAFMLGDNFHPTGVKSVDDHQFVEKFEKLYGGLGVPVFAVLGEHDWGRKGQMYNWRAQIEYTNKSKVWHMPSDVYSVTLSDLKIIALNTNSFPISRYQKSFLQEELSQSTARWNLVIGHKPIHSYGFHGDTDFMVKKVLPILCGRADLYLSGHEHNEQVLKADCGLPLVIPGSTAMPRPIKTKGPRTLYVNDEPGFAYLIVKDNGITVQLVTAGEEIVYTLNIPSDNKQRRK
jgi:tartrate-resistant acid phosphatase type 5